MDDRFTEEMTFLSGRAYGIELNTLCKRIPSVVYLSSWIQFVLAKTSFLHYGRLILCYGLIGTDRRCTNHVQHHAKLSKLSQRISTMSLVEAPVVKAISSP